MSDGQEMRRFDHHAVAVAQGAALLFSAHEDGGEMWTGHGPRLVSHRVRFAQPFIDAPAVHVSIGMWDIDGSQNQRADIRAARVTPQGFDVEFRTWGDTRIARIRAEWMAIGPVAHIDQWDD